MGKDVAPFMNPAVVQTFGTKLNELQAKKLRLAAYEEGSSVSYIIRIALERFLFSNPEKKRAAIKAYLRRREAMEDLKNAARFRRELDNLRAKLDALPSGIWDADLLVQKKAILGSKPAGGQG